MAIEALSRGAEHAMLVERDRAALGAIRDNLARARLAGGRGDRPVGRARVCHER